MTWARSPIRLLFPRAWLKRLRKHRDALIERVAETDEELTLKYLEGRGDQPADELRAALRGRPLRAS